MLFFWKKKRNWLENKKKNYRSSLKISSTWISLVYISHCMNKHCFRVSMASNRKKKERILRYLKLFLSFFFCVANMNKHSMNIFKDLNEIQNFFCFPSQSLLKKDISLKKGKSKMWSRREKKDEGIFNLFSFFSFRRKHKPKKRKKTCIYNILSCKVNQ